MTRLHFCCTLLSDVVLSSKAATEGFHLSLDYIPGAKFLGLVAGKHYDLNQQKQTLDLFHNGTVRFSDAQPCNGNLEIFYKVISGLHAYKKHAHQLQYYFVQQLTDEIKKQHFPESVGVLKDYREGYLNAANELLSELQNFSIKSAYDSDKHRAKDEQMYGYFALPKGSQWRFWVDVDDSQYLDLLKETLLGRRRLGRSSSAEYGLVEITEVPAPSALPPTSIPAGEIKLYALSNWCFYDTEGHNTVQPDEAIHLGLPAGSKILWEKSKVRYRNYLTWNRHRSNRDADRMVIERGSILVVQLSQSIQSDALKQGIGGHRSEGFGQVLINPSFLQDAPTGIPRLLRRKKLETKSITLHPIQKGAGDDFLLDFLSGKNQMHLTERAVDAKVNAFIFAHKNDYGGISSSQWGQIRNLAKNVLQAESLKTLLFHDKTGFCYSGQTESKWRENRRRETLKEFLFPEAEQPGINPLDLTMKLSSEMAKVAQNQ